MSTFKKKGKTPAKQRKMTEEKKQNAKIIFGLISSAFGKMLLESNGFTCDYRINGERIEDIHRLDAPSLKERIQLAVKDERYEDAARLKKLLDSKGKPNELPDHLHIDQ
jgi:hypothetical protein